MNELFNRAAVLTVGQANGSFVSASKEFSGFRIAFDIEKNSESAPNPAKISIYNLSAQSRAALENEKLACTLKAGYSGLGGGAPLVSEIFVGDVRRVTTQRQGPDLVTTLEAGDSETVLTDTHVDQAFGSFTTAGQVVSAVAKKLGLTIGTISPALTAVFRNGLSVSGLASDTLDTLAKQAGLEWHVTDGELNILAPTQATPEPAVVLSKSTGLIGFPSKTERGIELASLLNPEIKPGRAISLTSETITGVFRVRKAKYHGDTKNGQWTVTVEAV